ATPTGIRIDHATEIGESNLLTLAGNAGASVTWASSYFDLSSSFVGHLTGFSHEISVFAPPAGGILAGLPDSGVIAQAAPEPSTAILLVIGCAVAWVARRR
ncbi:MAG TPA: PEP-CTERM sorting domain-containing protein, partial [Lacipirellulaceae bacterium]